MPPIEQLEEDGAHSFHMGSSGGMAESLAETEWQPIETVPRDGTRILVHFARGIGVREVRWCSPSHTDDYELWCVDDRKHGPYSLRGYCEGDETHWMPLPPPPASA